LPDWTITVLFGQTILALVTNSNRYTLASRMAMIIPTGVSKKRSRIISQPQIRTVLAVIALFALIHKGIVAQSECLLNALGPDFPHVSF
jgi:hypothetical protein